MKAEIKVTLKKDGIPQGDPKKEFGEGKFINCANALDSLDQAFSYAIDQLKRKKSEQSLMDVARCLLAEAMALTFKIQDKEEAVLYLKTTDELWKRVFLPEYDRITDKPIFQKLIEKEGFVSMPHENWPCVAFAHNVKNFIKDKKKLTWLRQSYMRLKWGTFDRYLNPHEHTWESKYGKCANAFI